MCRFSTYGMGMIAGFEAASFRTDALFRGRADKEINLERFEQVPGPEHHQSTTY